MIPQKLRISGFLSYQSPVEIDFSDLHVACISGQNGSGKSAMLDAMTWALFSQARDRDDAIINDAAPEKRAEVIFEFQYESDEYKIQRIKPAGKSQIVDFFARSPGGKEWKILTEKTTRQTNAKICDVLRLDYETFINASFFLQGKADQFTNRSASERKAVLTNILNLDVWEEYKTRAALRRKEEENEITLDARQLADVESELSEEDERLAALESVKRQLGFAEKEAAVCAQAWENARAAQQQLKTLEDIHREQKEQATRLERQAGADRKRLSERAAELAREERYLEAETRIQTDWEQLQQARQELKTADLKMSAHFALERELNNTRTIVEREKNRLNMEMRSLLEQRQTLSEKCKMEPALREQLTQLETKISAVAVLMAQKDSIAQEAETLAKQISGLMANEKMLKEKTDAILGKLKRLQSAIGLPCPVCGRDMDPAHCDEYAKELNAEMRALIDQDRENNEKLRVTRIQEQEKKNALRQIALAEKEMTQLSMQKAPVAAKLAALAEEQAEWEAVKAGRLNALQGALREEAYCPSERADCERLSLELKEMRYDSAAHDALRAREKSLAGAEADWHQLVRAKATAEPLRRETAALREQIAHTEADQAIVSERLAGTWAQLEKMKAELPEIGLVRAKMDETQLLANRLRAQLGGAQQRVDVLESRKAEKLKLNESLKNRRILVNRLLQLEKAFGKNGIPALLIEQALPEIQRQANEILSRLTDDRMTLGFTTVANYSDKSRSDMKETLEIIISDEFGAREYALFSGGEAFRINFAIRMALSRILATRAGSRLQLLVIDEGFGSQDAEGRQRLAEAISAVQDDFEKILVITHLDELKEVFPSRIEVEKSDKGSNVRVFL